MSGAIEAWGAAVQSGRAAAVAAWDALDSLGRRLIEQHGIEAAGGSLVTPGANGAEPTTLVELATQLLDLEYDLTGDCRAAEALCSSLGIDTDPEHVDPLPEPYKDDEVRDLLSCALSGIAYWADDFSAQLDGASCTDYAPLQAKGFWEFRDALDDESPATLRLDRAKVIAGLSAFRQVCPQLWGDWIGGNSDRHIGDCFVQCALFGELRYA